MIDNFYVVSKDNNEIWYNGSYLDCKEWLKYNIKYIYHNHFDVVWFMEYERRLDMLKNI